MEWVERILRDLRASGLYRERFLSGKLRDFCSNDYLGFRKNPEVCAAAAEALQE